MIVRQGAVADDAVKIADCIIGGSIVHLPISPVVLEKNGPILRVIPFGNITERPGARTIPTNVLKRLQ